MLLLPRAELEACLGEVACEPLDLEHGKVLWSCADSSSSRLGAAGLGTKGDVDHPRRRYPYGTVVTSNYSGC